MSKHSVKTSASFSDLKVGIRELSFLFMQEATTSRNATIQRGLGDAPSLVMASLGSRPGTKGPSVSKLFLNWMVSTTKAFTWCEKNDADTIISPHLMVVYNYVL